MNTRTVTIAISIVLAVALNQWWGARRDREQRVWMARTEHLQRLHVLLRSESDSLDRIARALRERRHFTQTANDARKAVWRDEALTADVERHFPEYFREREQLIRRVLEYDADLGRVREVNAEHLPETLIDRADDLADAASLLSDAARRHAEETVLQGSCTYAPSGDGS